ncbi:MAG: type II secretion system protein GspK [Phycisphaerae bacterium]|nr:type II secretion system protein GspK [Phycisphaerae bacterium]
MIPRRQRRAFVLPVILVLLALLTLTMAGFVFFVRAEVAGLNAHAGQQQARLAAESGLEEIVALLRVAKHDSTQWFDNPQRMRHSLVWSRQYRRDADPVRELGSRREVLADRNAAAEAWRWSACAPRYDLSNAQSFRYGITPESAKINLNSATPQQLSVFMTPLLQTLEIENAQELIAGLVDWRDPDSNVTPGGAENEWYNTLKPAYNVKNAPFDTVEELLLVKGWNAIALYGEDTNRNGILDPNEDDGDASPPAWDNGDGILNFGVAPFLTVSTREPDATLANQPRANLRGPPQALTAQLQKLFPNGELSQTTISFLTQLQGSGFDFGRLVSSAQLYTQGYVAPAAIADAGSVDADGDGLPDDGGQPSSQPTSGPSSQPTDPSQQNPLAPPVLPQELMQSPVTLAELPFIMDGISVANPQTATRNGIAGLINVNVAPLQVLSAIPGMTGELANAIVATRQTLPPEQLRTPAWILVNGLCDTATFHQIAPAITTKAYQFQVDIVGYADHSEIARRFEWRFEMIGPLAQVQYFRELTGVGVAWPLDRDSIVLNAPGAARQ